jgi:hypothetical protein
VQEPVHRIFGRTRATVLGVALLSGAALPAAGLWPASASLIGLTGCPTSAGITTCTFSYTGSATSWTVPAGITHLTVGADGGSGASATTTWRFGGGTGGNGGEYRAALTGIPAGTVLSIFPGGAGNGTVGGLDAGSGGGSSTTDYYGNGGGGGGASIVSVSGDPKGLLVVAGGGGGAGGESNVLKDTSQLTGGPTPSADGGNGGGSGGVNGADGTPATAGTEGGGGSTTSATGGTNGGTRGCSISATDGGMLAGGASNSGRCVSVGGGGGSGYYGGGGSAAGAGAGGGSAFPAGVNTVDGITVTPDTGEHATHTGNGRITISYQKVPTRVRPNIFFNLQQTFTVTGTLTSFGGPVAGQPVRVSTGNLHLCTAITNSHGVAECVLTYAESIAIRLNAGRYTVTFPGSDGYLPSSANGQAIIHP